MVSITVAISLINQDVLTVLVFLAGGWVLLVLSLLCFPHYQLNDSFIVEVWVLF